MKAFLVAVAVIIGIGIGAAFVLGGMQETVATANATASVRVGEPGENLVDWH
jgi:hypothetical protein